MTILAAFRTEDGFCDNCDYDDDAELIRDVQRYQGRDGGWLYGVTGLLALCIDRGDISEMIVKEARAWTDEQIEIDEAEISHIAAETRALRAEMVPA